MKSFIIVLLAIFAFQTGFSQKSKKSIYFPQEQLIHPKCENSISKNACLDTYVERTLLGLLNADKTKRLFYNDTLNVSITFVVDKKGKIFEDFIKADYNDEIMTYRLAETTSYYIKQLPVFKIKNRKSRPYNSFHKFEYKYLIDFDNDKSLTKLKIPYTYTGGSIIEVPLFPDCKRINGYRDRICFQEKIQNHISENFSYPKEAQEKGIQGVVHVNFIIEKDGSIGHLISKGEYGILEEEATRIMSLLPKFKPGKRNGEPIRVPFSIPITFKVQ